MIRNLFFALLDGRTIRPYREEHRPGANIPDGWKFPVAAAPVPLPAEHHVEAGDVRADRRPDIRMPIARKARLLHVANKEDGWPLSERGSVQGRQ
jgi:hypothetical protein